MRWWLLASVLLSMGATIVLLAIKHQSFLARYRGATLYYSHRSPKEQDIVEKLAGSVVVLRPTKSAVPKLVLSSGQEVTGIEPISAVLTPFLDLTAPEFQGQRAALLLAIVGVIAFMYGPLCRKYMLLAGIPALFALAALAVGCVTCGASLDGIAPLIGAGLVGVAVMCLTLTGITARVARVLCIALSLGTVSQAALLVVEPRLCWACITVGTALVVMAQGFAQPTGSSGGSVLALSGKWSFGPAVLSVLVLCRASLAATNALPYAKSLTQPGSLVGKPIDAFAKGSPIRDAELMVSSFGCSACSVARANIQSLELPIREIPVCAGFSGDQCFDPGNEPLGTPTFLAVNRRGIIVWQHIGWPSSPSDQLDLSAQLQSWRKTK